MGWEARWLGLTNAPRPIRFTRWRRKTRRRRSLHVGGGDAKEPSPGDWLGEHPAILFCSVDGTVCAQTVPQEIFTQHQVTRFARLNVEIVELTAAGQHCRRDHHWAVANGGFHGTGQVPKPQHSLFVLWRYRFANLNRCILEQANHIQPPTAFLFTYSTYYRLGIGRGAPKSMNGAGKMRERMGQVCANTGFYPTLVQGPSRA